jgi:hypothetical protein
MQLAGSAKSEVHYVRKEAPSKQPSHIQDVPIQTKALTSSTLGILDLERAQICRAAHGCHFENWYTLLQQLPRQHKTFPFILHLGSVKWEKYSIEQVFGRTAKSFIRTPTFAYNTYSFWNE